MTKRILTFIAGMTAALNMAAEDLPAIANIYARPHQSLNGKWSYIVDPLENGYYDYRLKPMEKTGFFENRKQTSPDQLVEYNFDTSPQMEIPSDWNSKDEQLFMYEGTVWFKRDFRLFLALREEPSWLRISSGTTDLPRITVFFSMRQIF